MSENVVHDFFLERLQKDDWLGLSTVYFDNDYTIDVFATRGYVAYSPSKKCFFTLSCLDSTDSAVVEGTYATIENKLLGLQHNISVAGYEHMQHFEIAQYSRYQFYNDEQTVMPWAHIPSRDTIVNLVKDENTGLYPGTDTVGLITNYPSSREPSERIISAIGFYPQTDGAQQIKDPDRWYYSGAIVDGWKRFYNNQEKFKKMLADAFGVTDAI